MSLTSLSMLHILSFTINCFILLALFNVIVSISCVRTFLPLFPTHHQENPRNVIYTNNPLNYWLIDKNTQIYTLYLKFGVCFWFGWEFGRRMI